GHPGAARRAGRRRSAHHARELWRGAAPVPRVNRGVLGAESPGPLPREDGGHSQLPPAVAVVAPRSGARGAQAPASARTAGRVVEESPRPAERRDLAPPVRGLALRRAVGPAQTGFRDLSGSRGMVPALGREGAGPSSPAPRRRRPRAGARPPPGGTAR